MTTNFMSQDFYELRADDMADVAEWEASNATEMVEFEKDGYVPTLAGLQEMGEYVSDSAWWEQMDASGVDMSDLVSMAKAIDVLVSVDVRQFGHTTVILPETLPEGVSAEVYAEREAFKRLEEDKGISWDSLSDAELIQGTEYVYEAEGGLYETED